MILKKKISFFYSSRNDEISFSGMDFELYNYDEKLWIQSRFIQSSIKFRPLTTTFGLQIIHQDVGERLPRIKLNGRKIRSFEMTRKKIMEKKDNAKCFVSNVEQR